MHDFVKSFISSAADIDRLLPEYAGKMSPVIKALNLLAEMTAGGQSANGALFAARNTPVQNEDADLGIIFLAYWAGTLVRQIRQVTEKADEAQAVISRARNLITPSTKKDIRLLVDHAEAMLCEAKGNIVERDTLLRKAIKGSNPDSMRLPWLIAEYSLILARSGRLSEISRKLADYETTSVWPDITAKALLAKFVNQIETCNLHQAEQILSPLSRTKLPKPQTVVFETYKTLLPLLRSTLATTPTMTETMIAEDITPDWSLVIKSLSSGNSAQALKWARISERRDPVCLTGNSLISFNLVRTELAEKNIDAARRLSALRQSKGNSHYLDSFFEARAELLEGNIDSAAELFSTAMKDAKQHSARHRVELETTLAVEIPHHLVMYMSERAAKTAGKPRPTTRVAPAFNTSPSVSGASNVIGVSQAADELRRTVTHFARMTVPVLITGETGTGKDLIARAIHEESDLRDLPFIAVNCASISESILESELFGHEKGAFTGASTSRRGLFEEAGKGCIFLDEIGEISPKLQAALLRVLETGEIRPVGSSTPHKTSCRIIAATNADLGRMAEDGRFRQDILFRLKRLEINIPPLRNRTEDILPLASHFLNLNRTGDANAVMSEDLCRTMLSYQWPGNVRELRNVIERMRLMNSDKLYYESADITLPTRNPMSAQPLSLTGGTKKQMIPPEDTEGTTRAIPVAQPAPAAAIKKGNSKMRRLDTLKELFREHHKLTRSEIIETLKISPNIATSDLKSLAKEGMIERVQPTRSPRSTYFRIKANRQ